MLKKEAYIFMSEITLNKLTSRKVKFIIKAMNCVFRDSSKNFHPIIYSIFT